MGKGKFEYSAKKIKIFSIFLQKRIQKKIWQNIQKNLFRWKLMNKTKHAISLWLIKKIDTKKHICLICIFMFTQDFIPFFYGLNQPQYFQLQWNVVLV